MNDSLRDALRAGRACLCDGAMWRALAASALTWPVVLRAVALLLIVSAASLLALALPKLAAWTIGVVVAWWLVPLAMRRAGTIVAEHAMAVAPALVTGPSLPPRPTKDYRREWLALLVCAGYLPAVAAAQPWGDHPAVIVLLLAMQAWAAPGAIVRTVLAPRFRTASIDASLAARPVYWGAVALPFVAVAVALHRLAGWAWVDSGIALADAMSAPRAEEAAHELPLRMALWLAASIVAGVFATAAVARIAGAEMLRREGRLGLHPELLVRPAPPEPVPAPRRPTPAARRAAPARPPRKTSRWLAGALVVTLIAGYAARGSLVYVLLDHHRFSEEVTFAAWTHPQVRSALAFRAACDGNGDDLRKLLRAGIVPDDFEQHSALGCAAHHGGLEAVKALVEAGADVNESGRAIDALPSAAPLTPMQQALRTPAGLPVADWLLAHGARLGPDGHGGIDAAQSAAAANCLPCLAWLRQHGASMNGTAPATPLALWFDNPAQRDLDSDDALAQLLALGLSPAGVGADGRSGLHAAAAAGNAAAVRMLLARGADPALADGDGMKPLFYAASRLRTGSGNLIEDAARARRMTVVTALLAVTPSLDGVGTPSAPRRAVVMVDAYIDRPFDFGEAGARHADVRAAAASAGRTIQYMDGDLLARLPHDELRPLLSGMSDTQLATVVRPGGNLAIRAATMGDWPELLRAARGWPHASAPPRTLDERHCALLARALDGFGDASVGARDSWAVVDALLDTGVFEGHCGLPESGPPVPAIVRRPAAQQADWKARVAAMHR